MTEDCKLVHLQVQRRMSADSESMINDSISERADRAMIIPSFPVSEDQGRSFTVETVQTVWIVVEHKLRKHGSYAEPHGIAAQGVIDTATHHLLSELSGVWHAASGPWQLHMSNSTESPQ